MPNVQSLVTNNLNAWTAAIQKQSSSGRVAAPETPTRAARPRARAPPGPRCRCPRTGTAGAGAARPRARAATRTRRPRPRGRGRGRALRKGAGGEDGGCGGPDEVESLVDELADTVGAEEEE